MDPQMQALLPLMTTIVAELTARNGAVPAPQSMLCLTASWRVSLLPGARQHISLRQTIIPHSRHMVGSLGTLRHTLHCLLW